MEQNVNYMLKINMVFLIAVMLTGCDSKVEIKAKTTSPSKAISIIAAYAENNTSPEPQLHTYERAGVTGVNSRNIAKVNAAIDKLRGKDVDTLQEIQAVVDRLDPNFKSASDKVLIQIGKEDDANSSTVTIAQLNAIVPPLRDVNASNLTAYRSYIADPAHTFSNPATQPQIQAMISVVNSAQSLPAIRLPSGMRIDDTDINIYIASIYDNTPFSPAIDIQGSIDMGANTSGVLVKVPYTVTGAAVSLQDYTATFAIANSSTEDNESGIVATFSWKKQTNIPVGSGVFDAYISIDDSKGNSDNIYKAKKLDIHKNAQGFTAAVFAYPVDDRGKKGLLALKIIPGVPDRMMGKADNNGETKTHNFLYLPVTNPVTGKTWLNNNLGADYANIQSAFFDLTKQAEAPGDYHAYGSLFQWGRKADGHELIVWSNSKEGTVQSATVTERADNPNDTLFVVQDTAPYDWRVTPNNALWALETSTNNVCPAGYRVPSANEWFEETQSWDKQNSIGALNSTLKLPLAGNRSNSNGTLLNTNSYGLYWSRTPNSDLSASSLYFNSDALYPNSANFRAAGFSVRCIKN